MHSFCTHSLKFLSSVTRHGVFKSVCANAIVKFGFFGFPDELQFVYLASSVADAAGWLDAAEDAAVEVEAAAACVPADDCVPALLLVLLLLDELPHPATTAIRRVSASARPLSRLLNGSVLGGSFAGTSPDRLLTAFLLSVTLSAAAGGR